MNRGDWLTFIVTAAALVAIAAAALLLAVPHVEAAQPCRGIQGTASWYGSESGSITASGARFNPEGMTAAMPSRSMLGRQVRVTDLATGRSIVVLVDDIGPAAWTHRVIDLAHGAARALGMGGLARVCIDG